MGARDTEEQLDACKADVILLERQLATAEAKLAAIAQLLERETIDVRAEDFAEIELVVLVDDVRAVLDAQPKVEREWCVQYRCPGMDTWVQWVDSARHFRQWADLVLTECREHETDPGVEYRLATRTCTTWEATS